MELDLYRTFQEAGLPVPAMQMELPLGSDPDFAQWFSDTVGTLRPQNQLIALFRVIPTA